MAIGLINGLHPDPIWLSPALTFAMVLVMFVADHPAVGRRTMRQTVTLDVAYPQHDQLKIALGELLNAQVLRTVVLELDMVRDLTVVDVRFRTNLTDAPSHGLHDAPSIESIPESDRAYQPTSGLSALAKRQG